MDSNKIYEILNKFVSNKQRGILIDGSWGIGKTYQINLFLKKIEKDNNSKDNTSKTNKSKNSNSKTKVIYSSLFGLQSIRDLHTELYTKMHPRQKFLKHAINTISPAISIVPYAGNSISKVVSYAIGEIDANTSKLKSRTEEKQVKNRNIIILDDLERVDNDFDYSTLLGYINQLYLLGLKVVCICDTSKISNVKFDELKEKVFDRYYKVSKANKDVIKMYFRENSNIINDEIISLFNDNLRTASKTALFYREIKEHIDSLDNDKYTKIDDRTLIWYVSLIVSGINKSIISNNYTRVKKPFDTTFDRFFNSFNDEKIADCLNFLYQKDQEDNHMFQILKGTIINSYTLIESVAFAYLHDDYDCLDGLLKKIDTSSTDEIDFFYLSSAARIDAIDKYIKSSSSKTDLLTEKELSKIVSMYRFDEINKVKYNEDDYISLISKRMIGVSDRTISKLYFDELYSDKELEFVLKLRNKYQRNLIATKLEELERSFKNKDYINITETLNIVQQKKYFHMEKNGVRDLIDDVKNLFLLNDFFLPELKGTISEKEWNLAEKICWFIHGFNFEEELKKFLINKEKNTNDIDEKTRLKLLIEQYK